MKDCSSVKIKHHSNLVEKFGHKALLLRVFDNDSDVVGLRFIPWHLEGERWKLEL